MDTWKTRKLIRFADLVSERSWKEGCPYSGEVVFGIVQWLVREAVRRRRGERIYPDALEEIRGSQSILSSSRVTLLVSPTNWRSALYSMFYRLILSSNRGRFLTDMTRRGFCWPGSANLSIRHRVIARGAHRGQPDPSHNHRIAELGDYIGRDLKISYNSAHPNAVSICDVSIVITDVAYGLLVCYGYREDRGISYWHVPDDGLANDRRPYGGHAVTARKGEAFAAFLERAHAVMSELVTPSTEVRWSVFGFSVSVPTGFASAYVLAPTEEAAKDYCHGVMGANVVSPGAHRHAGLLPREALSARSGVVIYKGDGKPDADFVVGQADEGIVEVLKKLSGVHLRVAGTGLI